MKCRVAGKSSLQSPTDAAVVLHGMQTLEKEGVIAARRSRITILDRKGLQKRSNGTYVSTDA